MRTNQAGRLSNVVYFLALVAFCSFKVILAETKTKKPKKLSIKKRPFPCPKFLNRSLVGCLNPLSDQLWNGPARLKLQNKCSRWRYQHQPGLFLVLFFSDNCINILLIFCPSTQNTDRCMREKMRYPISFSLPFVRRFFFSSILGAASVSFWWLPEAFPLLLFPILYLIITLITRLGNEMEKKETEDIKERTAARDQIGHTHTHTHTHTYATERQEKKIWMSLGDGSLNVLD